MRQSSSKASKFAKTQKVKKVSGKHIDQYFNYSLKNHKLKMYEKIHFLEKAPKMCPRIKQPWTEFLKIVIFFKLIEKRSRVL